MPRPKSERHSTDLLAEIARLEQERKRLIQSEDQRRGAIIRELLAGGNAGALRALLQPVVNPRDAYLFSVDPAASGAKKADYRPRPPSRKVNEAHRRHALDTSANI